MWSPGAILGFFTHITSLSKLKWLIFTEKNRFSHSKSFFLFLFGENQAFCIHYTDQLEPVWEVRMYICESDTNTSLWLAERNGKHAHIPSTHTFFTQLFVLLLLLGVSVIKSRMVPLNRLNFCGVEKFWLHPFCHCESSSSTWCFLMDSSHQAATPCSSILGVTMRCDLGPGTSRTSQGW